MRVHGLGALVWITAAALLVACASTNSLPDAATSGGAMTITEEQIARTAANNAWDVLKVHARRYTYVEDQLGRPLRIAAQQGGVSSMALSDSDAPLVVMVRG